MHAVAEHGELLLEIAKPLFESRIDRWADGVVMHGDLLDEEPSGLALICVGKPVKDDLCVGPQLAGRCGKIQVGVENSENLGRFIVVRGSNGPVAFEVEVNPATIEVGVVVVPNPEPLAHGLRRDAAGNLLPGGRPLRPRRSSPCVT